VGDFFKLIRVVLLVFPISYKICFVKVFVSYFLPETEELRDKQGSKILNLSSKTLSPMKITKKPKWALCHQGH